MAIWWFTLTAVIGLFAVTDTEDLFSSTAQMRKLAASEELVRAEIKVYINKEEKRIAELKQ